MNLKKKIQSSALAALVALLSLSAHSASSAVELIYDAAGNLKQIKRQAPYGLGVTGFAPASGPAGTAVTIYGFGFSTTPANNTVTFNGVPATVAIADIGSLSVIVPSGATSGAISVAVGGLTSSSAKPFTVLTSGLPPGYLQADVETTVRLADGGAPGVVEIGTVNHHAAILFDLLADRYYTLQFGLFGTSPINSRVDYKVFDGSNTQILAGNFGDTWGRPTIHLPKTVTAGTYTVMVSPGIATFTAQASLSADPLLVVDGSMTNVATTGRWQSTRNIFNATAGQRIGLGVTALTMSPPSTNPVGFRIYQPNGVELPGSLTSCYSQGAGPSAAGNCDGEFVASSAGTYVMIEESFYPIQSSYSIQLSSEHTAALAPDVATAVSLSRLGQDGRYTYTASAGDNVAIELSGVTPAAESKAFNLAVLRPNGTQLTSASASAGAPAYLELGTLTTAGDYSLLVDPSYAAYGTARLTVKSGATLDTTSAPSAFSTSNAGDSVRFRFAGTAGQSGLTIGIKNLAYVGSSTDPTGLYVYRPDGTSIASAYCYRTSQEGRCKLALPNLPTTGTYSIRLSPPGNVQVSGTIALSAEVTGTLTAGVPTAFAMTRPGQGGRFTFSGTAGQSTSIEISQLVTTPNQTMYAYVYKPDGNYLAGSSAYSNGIYVNLPSLPTAGTYSVTLDPYLGVEATGNITLDAGTAVTVNGSTQAISTTVVGETVRYTFSGTAGTRLEMGISGLAPTSASGTSVYLLGPDGYSATGFYCYVPPGACEGGVASLSLTGTYVITVQPPTGVVLSAGTLAVSTPATGTMSIDGASQSVALSRTGQTARYTFSGTSGQLLRLNWTNPAITGGTSVPVSILTPSGSTLSSLSYSSSASGYDIPSLPTTGTYTLVVDPAAAVTTSVDFTLVTRP